MPDICERQKKCGDFAVGKIGPGMLESLRSCFPCSHIRQKDGVFFCGRDKYLHESHQEGAGQIKVISPDCILKIGQDFAHETIIEILAGLKPITTQGQRSLWSIGKRLIQVWKERAPDGREFLNLASLGTVIGGCRNASAEEVAGHIVNLLLRLDHQARGASHA